MATILVVDDELGIRALLSEILTDEGHTVELAENAAQARRAREAARPDLVLLDIWMPDVDGITLLEGSGNVGIGTASPVSLLTVQGEARITGNLISAGFTSNSTNTVFNSDTLTVPFVNATQVLASTLGTAITGTALQVSGNLYATDTIASANPMMFRNRIINGDMRINQRAATSLSITQSAATTQYLFDRWGSVTNQVTGYFTDSVQTLTTSDTPYQYGFRSSMRCTATTGAALPAYIYPIYQVIEANNLTDLQWGSAYGASVTVSFWFRSNMAAGSTGSMSLRNAFASSTWALYNTTFTVVGGGAWQYVVITVPPPASGTNWFTGTGAGIEFLPLAINAGGSAAGWTTGSASTGFSGQTTWWTTTGNYVEITGVQFEKGLTASPFEFRSYGAELALCQRYFQIINATGGQNYYAGLTGGVNSYVCSIVTFKLTTAMRITPTQYWYTDQTPLLITVAGASSALNYAGNASGAGISIPGLSPAAAVYGVDSSTNTTTPGTFSGLCQGTYTVMARDAAGCTATTTYTLALPPIPDLVQDSLTNVPT
jgi:CheY-like chemotaxis protein